MYRQVKSIEPYVIHIHVYESKVALQRFNIKTQNKCLKIQVSLTESWRKGYATPTNKVCCFGEFASSERQTIWCCEVGNGQEFPLLSFKSVPQPLRDFFPVALISTRDIVNTTNYQFTDQREMLQA